MVSTEVIDSDVLVIGGGAAGCRAAIEANDLNVNVVMVVKDIFGRSGCSIMSAYYSGVGPWARPGDERNKHFVASVKGSEMLCDQELMKIMIDEGPDRLAELERYGAIWDREQDGRIKTFLTEGHEIPRTLGHGWRSGKELMRSLTGEILRRGIQIVEETMVIDLLKHGASVVGATALSLKNGRFMVFRTKSVVMTTGSPSQVYRWVSCPPMNTSDGHAMAIRAGAVMRDMEQELWFPACLSTTRSEVLRPRIAIPVTVAGAPVRLYNAGGEEFMRRYFPSYPEKVAPKDTIARAIVTEVNEGRGSPHRGVWADATTIPPEILKTYEKEFMVVPFQELGVDPKKSWLEIAPVTNTNSGGIVIDKNAATTVPGLYAAGCCAGGVHGGGRIGGSGIINALTFGRRAGKSAAEYAQRVKMHPFDNAQIESHREMVHALLNRNEGITPATVKMKLKDLMWENVGPVKSASSISKAIATLNRMKSEELPRLRTRSKTTVYNRDLMEALEIRNMILVSEVMARSALMRQESRGPFIRTDFPEKDDKNWLRTIFAKLDEEQLQFWTEEIDFPYLKSGSEQ